MKEPKEKLSEFAALLKSARQKKDSVQIEPVVEKTIESVVEEVPEVHFGIRSEEPVQMEAQSPTVLVQLQKDFQNLKKIVEQQNQRPIYQPSYSGGGADNLSNIDRTVRTVSADYTPTTRDWYIGVNSNSIVTITLPTKIKNGREFVIKDESGHAELTPIRILGNIDSDPDGVEIRINYGSVTLLYNNGWRII